MKILKLGHCCLLIETKDKRILTDPGYYTAETHSKLENIDYILITHEHKDHCHIDSLKILLEKNPNAVVYTNSSVGEILNKEGIKSMEISDGEQVSLGGVSVIGIGEKHAEHHSSIPVCENTGFLIDERLWYPGDAFTDPKRKVEILALPVCGGWMKLAEAIDYALMLKPKIVFPVHDGQRLSSAHKVPEQVLVPQGIQFIPMIENDSKEF